MLICLFKTSLALPFLYSSALQTSLASVQGFSLMVTTHKSTILKESGIAEETLIYTSLRVKKILYPVTIYKKVHIYVQKFSVSFFSFPDMHQCQYLDGCQAIGRSSFLICAF